MLEYLQICPSLKDIILSEDDDICKGIDLDVALNFNCCYEMVSFSQEQCKNQLDNGGLDSCLVLEKPLPVMESNNQIKNSLEVLFLPNLESTYIKTLSLCLCLSDKLGVLFRSFFLRRELNLKKKEANY